jgi:hypothetical protein
MPKKICAEYRGSNRSGVPPEKKLALPLCLSKHIRTLTQHLVEFRFCKLSQYGTVSLLYDRLWGLVVRVPSNRPRGPGFDSRHYQTFWVVVNLEQGPLSFMTKDEIVIPVYKTDINGRGVPLRCPRDTPLSTKIGTIIRWPAAVAQSVQFACGLKTTEVVFVCLFHVLYIYNKAIPARDCGGR